MQRELWGDAKYYVHGVYLPPECEVLRRAGNLRWLLENGFDEDVIGSVMDFDMPTFETVVRLVMTYGVETTRKKLDPFIVKVKYYGTGTIPEVEEASGNASQ